MLLKFLGTSGGELYPGLWCRCGNCEAARHGSAQDRRQSAALYLVPETVLPGVSSGVLIDFPSEKKADPRIRDSIGNTAITTARANLATNATTPFTHDETTHDWEEKVKIPERANAGGAGRQLRKN